ncbi:MAG: hypothetical protein JWN83_1300 [Chitinophagaceae bacterium]|nr:hypothetical protein [Chitinophagaceae bacterium]
MPSTYLILDPDLHEIAEYAMKEIMSRYNLRNPLIEQAINPNISWRPTFLWKKPTEYLACEPAFKPLPPIINSNFMDIQSSGLPIRIIVAYPHDNSISITEFQKDLRKAKQHGIGYMSVDATTKKANIEYKGVSSILSIPAIDFSQIKSGLRPKVIDAYDMYMSGDPKHGVQELGQLMEKCMTVLATQAIGRGKLRNSNYVPGRFYKLTKLIDELLNEKIIDLGILGNCRGFVYPRNSTSHPQDIASIKKIERKLKENFIKGVSILEELPAAFKQKGYNFRI